MPVHQTGVASGIKSAVASLAALLAVAIFSVRWRSEFTRARPSACNDIRLGRGKTVSPGRPWQFVTAPDASATADVASASGNRLAATFYSAFMTSPNFPSGIPMAHSAHVPRRLAREPDIGGLRSWNRIFKERKEFRHIPPCRASCCFWRPDYSSMAQLVHLIH
jgi:hypothetical protein